MPRLECESMRYPRFSGECDAVAGALARDVRPEGASKRPLAGRVSPRAAEDFDAVRNGSHGDFKGFLSALWTAG